MQTTAQDLPPPTPLADLQRRLDAALLAGEVGIFEWQVNEDRVWGDRHFSRILNLPLAGGLASIDQFRQALHPDDRAVISAQIGRTVETGCPYRAEYRVHTPAGMRWISARGVGDRNDAGEVVRIYGAVVDVTDRKQAEEALREARDALARTNLELERRVRERTAELNALVGELDHFSYTLTHHLRAPLRAMQGLGELLVDQAAELSPDMQHDMLRRIVGAAHRMDELITDALNYGKLLRHEHVLKPVDATALLRDLVASYPEFEPPLAHIHIDDDIPPVLGDEAGLTQCFTNLLSNAVKFVAPDRIPCVRVWAQPNDGFVRLWFEDNGIGIPGEYHEQIWDMFQRLDKSISGTGIGLALVAKVVQRLGGRVGVESAPGIGSRFWLELPPA